MSGVQAAPAPWKLKGRSWIFALPGISKNASFPSGFAAPSEAEVMASGGEFISGLGQIQVVSYTESPVGPYDELIYTPGRWKYPDGTSGFRITRIYVSTKESTENGRRNWNIPKHVANFNFHTTEDGKTSIMVTHPDESFPFFKATVKPIPVLSRLSVTVNFGILGDYFSLIQPPLPAGERSEEVATSQWAKLIPGMRGSVRLVTVASGLDGKVGDGVGFPAVVPWSVAVAVEALDMDFLEPSLYNSL